MHCTPLELLQRYWGYSAFRPLQLEVIESCLGGHDTLALMPTGGGKSITYQLAGLCRGGLTLVVSPLIALMDDQVQALAHRGLRAYRLHSGLEISLEREALQVLAERRCEFLYVSPERLVTEGFLALVQQLDIGLLAVDEAHCISQWGHEFRPEYRAIAVFRERHPDVPCMAVTATATPAVVQDILTQLRFQQPKVLQMSFARRNLIYTVVKAEDTLGDLYRYIMLMPGTGIVYCRKRRFSEVLAHYLTGRGVCAAAYHAGLSAEQRALRQAAWMSGQIGVMVATNAFGMGIDKPDVRYVVHVGPPPSLEEYYQEAGRAGRDGKLARALLLYNEDNIAQLQSSYAYAYPSKELIALVYSRIVVCVGWQLDSEEQPVVYCSVAKLARQLHCQEMEVESSLRILAFYGWLSYYPKVLGAVEVTLLRPLEQCLEQLEASVGQLLASIARQFSLFEGRSTYVPLGVIALAEHRQLYELEEELGKMVQRGVVSCREAPFCERVQLLREPPDELSSLVDSGWLDGLRCAHQARTRAMLSYLEDKTTCRSQQLCGYFGETVTEPCGSCDVCSRVLEASLDAQTIAAMQGAIRSFLRTPRGIEEVQAFLIPLNWPIGWPMAQQFHHALHRGYIELDEEFRYCWIKD